MLISFCILEILSVIWMQTSFGLSLEVILIYLIVINLILAGISLRLGGYLTKGPYLPETIEGLSKSTKAVFGKPQ